MAGFVSLYENGKYHIALANYKKSIPPIASFYNDCLLFTTKYEMGENSVSALDVIVIETEYADQSEDVSKISHQEVPGFIPSSGFQHVANLEELANYFESGINFRNNTTGNGGASLHSFESKCLLGIKYFFDKAVPRNEFPTIKLYKELAGAIRYWQIFANSKDPISLVIHCGILGESGEYSEIANLSFNDAKESYDSHIAARLSEGYGEYNRWERMILQFPTGDEWGGTDDLDFRNEMWEYLDKYLFWTGNGSINGGDLGSGTANLFFDAISADIAIDTIVQALNEKKIVRPFIIAVERNQAEKEDSSTGVEVLYPKGYQNSFFY